MRLVEARLTQLTIEELDESALQVERTDPEHATELRHMKAWRSEHPFERSPHEAAGRVYLVLR